jgi:hypothetical protein
MYGQFLVEAARKIMNETKEKREWSYTCEINNLL